MRNLFALAAVAATAAAFGTLAGQAQEPEAATTQSGNASVVRELKRINRNLTQLNRTVGDRPAGDPTDTLMEVLKQTCENTAGESTAGALAC